MNLFSVQHLPAEAERRDRYRISGHNCLAGGQHPKRITTSGHPPKPNQQNNKNESKHKIYHKLIDNPTAFLYIN